MLDVGAQGEEKEQRRPGAEAMPVLHKVGFMEKQTTEVEMTPQNWGAN